MGVPAKEGVLAGGGHLLRAKLCWFLFTAHISIKNGPRLSHDRIQNREFRCQ